MSYIRILLLICSLLGMSIQGFAQNAIDERRADSIFRYIFTEEALDIKSLQTDTLRKAMGSANLKMVVSQIEAAKGKVIKTSPQFFAKGQYLKSLYFESKDSICLSLFFNARHLLEGIYFVKNPLAKATWKKPSYSIMGMTQKPFLWTSDGLVMEGVLDIAPIDSSKKILLIMLSGSGPNDEKASIGPNQVFTDIAYGLAREGISTFRFAKRQVQQRSKLDLKNFTPEQEYLIDALSAIDTLSKSKELSGYSIYLLGHSQGGMVAPEVARRTNKVKGIILFAAPARHLEDMIADQIGFLTKGNSSPDADQKRRESKELQALIHSGKYMDKSDSDLMGLSPAYWKWMSDYDVLKVGNEIKVPILLTFGGKDYQVTRKEEQLFRKAWSGRANTTFQNFPNLNHIGFEELGEPNPAAYNNPGHVDYALIASFGSWLKKQK
jgi:uncharacterized protein